MINNLPIHNKEINKENIISEEISEEVELDINDFKKQKKICKNEQIETSQTMKEKLLETDIEMPRKSSGKTITEYKNKSNFLWWLLNKDFEKNGFPNFKKGLNSMLEAWIITEHEKNQILEDLKDPEVRESINTRISVRWVSMWYTWLNFFIATPIATLLWPTVWAWLVVFISLYILKRFIINWVVHITWKNLEKKTYISNISMVPIIGEHATLIELYKKHPISAKYFFAFRRTLKKQKKFNNETNKETKQKYWEKRKEKATKEAMRLDKRSNRRVELNNTIEKEAIKIKNWLQVIFRKQHN